MSVYQWETLPDGVVMVMGPSGPELLTLDPSSAPERARIERVESWTSLARDAAERHGVPIAWVVAVIRAESAGYPYAISPMGAVGLMQVVPAWHGTTRAALLVPEHNVDVGTSILADLAQTFDGDLPRVASAYNAGFQAGPTPRPHPSSSSPWGMRENVGYITNVVRGNNYWATSPPVDRPRLAWGKPPGGGLFSALVVIGALAAAAGAVVWWKR